MSVFSEAETAYLSKRRLGRIATVGADGTPHVVPVGWSYDPALEAIEVGGLDFARTKKFRDVQRSGRIASVDPWHVRGIEIRGRAEAVTNPRPLIRIFPERVVSWGLGNGGRSARTV